MTLEEITKQVERDGSTKDEKKTEDQDHKKKQGAVIRRNSWETATVRPVRLYALSNKGREMK